MPVHSRFLLMRQFIHRPQATVFPFCSVTGYPQSIVLLGGVPSTVIEYQDINNRFGTPLSTKKKTRLVRPGQSVDITTLYASLGVYSGGEVTLLKQIDELCHLLFA